MLEILSHLTGEMSLNTHKHWYRAFIDINDYPAVLRLARRYRLILQHQYRGLSSKVV